MKVFLELETPAQRSLRKSLSGSFLDRDYSDKWKLFEGDLSDLLKEREIEIDETAEIKDYVKIGNHVSISRYARIEKWAIIYELSTIKQHAEIEGWCEIGPAATIGEVSSIGEGSKIKSGVTVSNNVKIGDRVIIESLSNGTTMIGPGSIIGDLQEFAFKDYEDHILNHCLYIIGSKDKLNYYGNHAIAIGNIVDTFEGWEKNYKAVLTERGYNSYQLSEYKAYIDLFIKLYRIC